MSRLPYGPYSQWRNKWTRAFNTFLISSYITILFRFEDSVLGYDASPWVNRIPTFRVKLLSSTSTVKMTQTWRSRNYLSSKRRDQGTYWQSHPTTMKSSATALLKNLKTRSLSRNIKRDDFKVLLHADYRTFAEKFISNIWTGNVEMPLKNRKICNTSHRFNSENVKRTAVGYTTPRR